MKRLFFFAAFIISLLLSFINARSLSAVYGGISVRTAEALTATQRESIEKYARQGSVALTLWREEKAQISNTINKVSASTVFFTGSANAAFGGEYLSGEAPFSADGFACSISQELSEKLFKSTDVLGLSVFCNEREYKIRGIFKGYGQQIALLRGEGGYNCIELEGSYTADEVQGFIGACGIQNAEIVYANSISAFFEQLKLLPCLVAFIMLGACLLKEKNRFSALKQELILFIAALIFAFSLFYILKAFPVWLLPPKLSSAKAWADIYLSFKEQIFNYLSINPYLKDTAARLLIVKCTVFSSLSAYFISR